MNVLVVLAHPNPGSFNHAIAQTVVETLRALGHSVAFHDLDAERFDPVFTAAELARDARLPEAIEAHCRELDVAEGLAIVHPNWWSAPPAILRGWVDRVMRAGRAYNFVPDGQGGARAVGLLKLRAALILNTANTPQDQEEARYGDPLQTHWVRVVCGLLGVKTVDRCNFAPVIVSTPAQRAQWLAEVQARVRSVFPA